MLLRWFIATLHLLALPLGLGAVCARSRGLWLARNASDLPRVFLADNLWGLAAVLLLDLWPMTTLIRWRIGSRRGTSIQMSTAPALARIGAIQLGLVVLMVFAATAVARGYFF